MSSAARMGHELRGRRIIVTRTRERAAGMVDLLHAAGAVVTVVPLIATVPIAAPAEIEAACTALSNSAAPRWVVFTSATAARLVLNVVGHSALRGVSVAAVGPETEAALREAGVEVTVVAAKYLADELGDALVARGVAGAAVWLPQAERARGTLAHRLRTAGVRVVVTPLYRSEMPAGAAARLRTALQAGADAITLTSGSTARHLARAVAGAGLAPELVVACIGPQTAAEARKAGLPVALVAQEHTGAGLVAALVRHFASGQTVP
jgi:uroporphyrinogen III methyltransferase/synthase